MKPILVLQHAHYDWPGYFTDCLINWEIPHVIVNVAAGDLLPYTITDYSGFAIMGGAMSANDELNYPHLAQAYALIHEAFANRIPIIGHCMQFHVEALPEKINHWLDTAREDIESANDQNIHSEDKIRHDNWLYTEGAQAVARQLYTRWLKNVVV